MTDENLPEIVQQSVVIDIHMSRSWELGLFLSKSAKKYLKNSSIFKHDFVATKLLVLTDVCGDDLKSFRRVFLTTSTNIKDIGAGFPFVNIYEGF